MPGARVVALGPGPQARAVTDPHGCYALAELTAGTYVVEASIAGFLDARREGVVVEEGRTTQPVNLSLCPGALHHIDWIHPRGLEDAWRQVDAVAYVRIEKTRPTYSECPTGLVEHTATVLELLKDMPAQPLGRTVTLFQEQWEDEPAPYPAGQELIVFLKRQDDGFVRQVGPYYSFLVSGSTVVSRNPRIATEGVTLTEFLLRLRKLGG